MVKFVLPLHFQSLILLFDLALFIGDLIVYLDVVIDDGVRTERNIFLNLSLSLHFACPVSPSWMTH